MSTLELKIEAKHTDQLDAVEAAGPKTQLDWETPKMEDVSEQVMAQPYIRFT